MGSPNQRVRFQGKSTTMDTKVNTFAEDNYSKPWDEVARACGKKTTLFEIACTVMEESRLVYSDRCEVRD